MPTVQALCNVPFGNGVQPKGAIFEATEQEANILVALQRVKRVSDAEPSKSGQDYMTRDMRTDPPRPMTVTSFQAPAPPPAVVSAPIPEHLSAPTFEAPPEVPDETKPSDSPAELDSSGAEWNADLHVSSKAKNADGTWRKKPGARRD